MFGVKMAAILIIQCSIMGIALSLGQASPEPLGFAPSLGRRQREEEEGPSVGGWRWPGTARCQWVRSLPSGRRAGAAPFPAVVPQSEHTLSRQPGHRQARRCLEKLQPFSLVFLSSSCKVAIVLGRTNPDHIIAHP